MAAKEAKLRGFDAHVAVVNRGLAILCVRILNVVAPPFPRLVLREGGPVPNLAFTAQEALYRG